MAVRLRQNLVHLCDLGLGTDATVKLRFNHVKRGFDV